MGVPSAANVINQLDGSKYDPAANVRWDGTNSYQYDAESRVASTNVGPAIAPSMYYLYNGDGERVAKLNASENATLAGPADETCPLLWGPVGPAPFQPPVFLSNQALSPTTTANGTTSFVPVGGPAPYQPGPFLLDAKLYWGSEPKAESDVCGNITKEYIYLNGKRIAYQDWTDATGGVYYYFADNLGSASVVADDQGNVLDESDFYPYGGENPLASGTNQRYKFTGKERDDESGNDYFGARYYSSNMGRWMSPDWDAKPTAVPYADFADPQSLNLYGYVMNNPLSKTDPTGHDGCCQTFIDFMNGASGAYSNDVSAGMTSRDTPSSGAGQAGATFGDSLALAQGAGEALLGGTAALGGGGEALVTSPTVVLAVPGAATAVAGTALASHGVVTMATAEKNLSGAGRNDQKGNQKRSDSAAKKLDKAKTDLAAAKGATPSAERSASIKQAQKDIKHLEKKVNEKSENHSRVGKGQQQ